MYREIFDRVRQMGEAVTAVCLTGTYAGSRCLFEKEGISCWGKATAEHWESKREELTREGTTGVVPCQGEQILVERLYAPPRLVICGGGHISYYLCPLGKMLGYEVTVLDDREDFVSKERFPDADTRICCDFGEMGAKVSAHSNTYYVVVTSGHMGDEVCVRQILDRPYAYLGMIGSKGKVARTRENLLRDGFSQEKVEEMYAPIGIKLGGQLPQEIAVSIAAELIQVKSKRGQIPAEEAMMDAVSREETGMMLTIISKEGSSPRGTGSKMFFTADGREYGSIGGGAVEYAAAQEVKKLLAAGEQPPLCREYVLNQEQARNLGMVCGGRIRVLFERL